MEVKWDAEAGAKQGDEAAVAVCSAEVGQGQAAKISIDLYSHPLIKPSAKEFGGINIPQMRYCNRCKPLSHSCLPFDFCSPCPRFP